MESGFVHLVAVDGVASGVIMNSSLMCVCSAPENVCLVHLKPLEFSFLLFSLDLSKLHLYYLPLFC